MNCLLRLGEDPNRDGLLRTPEHIQNSLEFLTKGYQQDADKGPCGARSLMCLMTISS